MIFYYSLKGNGIPIWDTARMELENITLSEPSQTQRMITPHDSTSVKHLAYQSHRERP
jgi:hypothetical protein